MSKTTPPETASNGTHDASRDDKDRDDQHDRDAHDTAVAVHGQDDDEAPDDSDDFDDLDDAGDDGDDDRADDAKGPGKGAGKPKRIRLTVIVNTDDTVVLAKGNWTLRKVAKRALLQTGVAGRDLADFRLKDATGAILDLTRTVKSYGFESGTELFLSLEAGANG